MKFIRNEKNFSCKRTGLMIQFYMEQIKAKELSENNLCK